MKHKKLTVAALLLLGLGFSELQAQMMTVKEKNATQTSYSLSGVRKLTFSGGNVTVLKTDKSTGVFALSGLIYLTFGDVTTAVEEQVNVD